MSKPVLGVIGGMGTQATACFYEKLHKLQNVSCEQDYLDVLLYSKPSIPDRTAFITGKSEDSPLDSLITAARILESAGVSCIAIPCVTSHYFYDKLSESVEVPILNLLVETANLLNERNVGKVCLLATDGTIKGRFFNTAFEKHGIEVTTLPDDRQSELMEMIYNIKCGDIIEPDALINIIEQAQRDEAEVVVLGCTELCIIAEGSSKVVNTLDVLAEAALRQACRSN